MTSTNAAATMKEATKPTAGRLMPTARKKATNTSRESVRPRSIWRTASSPHCRCVKVPITVTIAG